MCNMKNYNFSSTKQGGWLVNSLNCTNAPNQLTNGKLLITSKKIEPVVIRRPVKDCYCNAELFTSQCRLKRTHTKSSCRFKNDGDLENNVAVFRDLTRPPLSCDTLSKVQSIAYSPRSKFLRSKLFHNEICFDPMQGADLFRCRQSVPKSSSLNQRSNSTKPKMLPKAYTRSAIASSPMKQSPRAFSMPSKRNSKKQVPRQVSSQAKRRAVTSPKRCPSKGTQVSGKKSPFKRASAACTLCRKFCCPGCSNAKPKCSPRSSRTMLSDIEELYQFRKKNYLHTHGSRCSLDSSADSGSLQHYLLNERLFPQPASKVHRGDVMLTIPANLTKQNKRIYYLPKYLVEQNGPGRAQRCPLTGHAIDIGLLKRTHLPNSLALRYQKLVS